MANVLYNRDGGDLSGVQREEVSAEVGLQDARGEGIDPTAGWSSVGSRVSR